MGMSFWHLLLILVIVFILFGAGKLPRVMGDVGRGIRSLRDGLKGEEENANSGRVSNHADTAGGTIIDVKPADKEPRA